MGLKPCEQAVLTCLGYQFSKGQSGKIQYTFKQRHVSKTHTRHKPPLSRACAGHLLALNPKPKPYAQDSLDPGPCHLTAALSFNLGTAPDAESSPK